MKRAVARLGRDPARASPGMTRRASGAGPPASSGSGGLGLGNVRSPRDQLLVAGDADALRAPRHAFLASPATVALVGAPMALGQPKQGTERGPALLREAGLREMLGSLGWRVDDRGDVDMSFVAARGGGGVEAAEYPTGNNSVAGGVRHGDVAFDATRRLFAAAKRAHDDGCVVATLGGDHSIALGSLAAALVARPETRVLWVDAHADANTPQSSPSKNLHGMPLAFLLGLASDERVDWIPNSGSSSSSFPHGLLAPDRLAYVGVRDVDRAERHALRALKRRGAFVATMHEVDGLGIGEVMRRALAALGYDDNIDNQGSESSSSHAPPPPPLHLSYDIDAIDPEHAPSTGTVVRGGLSYREAHYVCEAAWLTGAMSSLDIVEVNPSLTDAKLAMETVDLAASLVASSLGDAIL